MHGIDHCLIVVCGDEDVVVTHVYAWRVVETYVLSNSKRS